MSQGPLLVEADTVRKAHLCANEGLWSVSRFYKGSGALPPRTAALWSPPRPPRRDRTGPAGETGTVTQEASLRGLEFLLKLLGRTRPVRLPSLVRLPASFIQQRKSQISIQLFIAENKVIVPAFKET